MSATTIPAPWTVHPNGRDVTHPDLPGCEIVLISARKFGVVAPVDGLPVQQGILSTFPAAVSYLAFLLGA
jgi:hypothetical protein